MTRRTRKADRRRVSAVHVAKGEHCSRCGMNKADVLCAVSRCPFAKQPEPAEIVLREWSTEG